MSEMERRKQAEARRRFLSETLTPHTVANPTYTHQGKQPCDTDTRVEVLADIGRWVLDISSKSRNFLWLTGDPGCGKSAVTASIARECKDKHILWAQFFINRNNDDTTKPNSYFPSIARQFADRSSDVQCAIHDAILEKPSLMDGIGVDQATKLFIDTIGVACSLHPNLPVVVVIDGLDETDRSRLKETATVFSRLFEALREHPNAKVFISSRTEDDIRSPFARTMSDRRVKHIHLDTSAQSSIDDVAAFLRRRVTQIVEDNDLNWEVWPGEERLRILTIRASGLFIWAVTVAKFLQEQIDTLGTECLDNVLDLLNAEGMADINTLYNIILRLAHTKSSEWEFEKFRRIVGAIVVLREPLSLAGLRDLLNLRNSTANASVDVVKFIRRLRTVLVAGTDAITAQTVPRLHKSFFEFITSENVDSHFRIDQESADTELGCQCLWHLGGGNLRVRDRIPPVRNYNIKEQNTLSISFRYSIQYWALHLPRLADSGAVVADGSFGLDEIQNLLTHSMNDRHLGPVDIIAQPGQSLIEMSVDGKTRKWDATTGIESETALTLKDQGGSIDSIAFSPDGMHIASASTRSTICLWDTRTGAIVRLFSGHTQAVRSVAFSPDGTKIASGSSDGTIRLWSTATGETLHKPLTTGTGRIFSVAFSPDGKYLVSGSAGDTMHLWDVHTGLLQKWDSSREKADKPQAVTFSPDGTKIATGSASAVCIWSALTAQLIASHSGHSDQVVCVAFSPDGTLVASGALDDTIVIWSTISGKKEYITGAHEVAGVLSVAFSPDGNYIVSGGMDARLRLWSTSTLSCIDAQLHAYTKPVRSVSFSPNGGHIASSSGNGTIHIQHSPVAIANLKPLLFTCFSPDGKWTASVTEDNVLYICEAGVYYRLDHGNPANHSEPNNIHSNFHSLRFSSDGTHILAALVDGTLHLWNTASLQLIISLSQSSTTRVVESISFIGPRHLSLKFVDGTAQVWEGSRCDTFKRVSQLPQALPQSRVLFFKSTPERWSYKPNFLTNSRQNAMRCYSQPNGMPVGGLWAVANNHIIRGRPDGSLTILPITRSPPTLSTSHTISDTS